VAGRPALGLWAALFGWIVARRPGLDAFRVGLLLVASVLGLLAPLCALGYGLLAQRDAGQVLPLSKVLLIAWLPTALGLGLLAWAGLPAWRRYGRRAAAAVAALLLLAGAMAFRWPESGPLAPAPAAERAARVPAGGPGVRAAAAAAEITPTLAMLREGVYLGGYGGRPGPAEAVHDPLYFRILVLEEGSERLIFVQADTVGIGNRLGARLRRVAREHGDTEHIFIASTHTHAGPDLQGIWGGVPASYEAYLVARLGEALQEATGRLAEARLRIGAREVEGASLNRRGWERVPGAMHVLQAVDASGQPIATLVNFGVHPTVLPRTNLRISTDFVGPMLAALEREQGGTALFVNGAQGDVVPEVEQAGDMYARALAYGQRLAGHASQALQAAEPVAPAGISVRSASVGAPLQNWGFQLLMSLGILRYDAAHLGVIPGIRVPVSVIRIGPELTLATVPGEMVTRLADQVTAMLPGQHRLILGLTEESLGYLITRDEWATGRNGDYEESVSIGPVMGPLFERALRELLDRDPGRGLPGERAGAQRPIHRDQQAVRFSEDARGVARPGQ
jgi:hypothetical protein